MRAREQRQGREEYREATRPAKLMIIWIIIFIRIIIFRFRLIIIMTNTILDNYRRSARQRSAHYK